MGFIVCPPHVYIQVATKYYLWQVAKTFIVYWNVANIFVVSRQKWLPKWLLSTDWEGKLLSSDVRAKSLLSTDGADYLPAIASLLSAYWP